MSPEVFVITAMIGVVVVGLWAALRWTGRLQPATASRRLEKWRRTNAQLSEVAHVESRASRVFGAVFVDRLAQWIGGLSNVRASELSETQALLRQAGFRSPSAPRVFAGARVSLELVFFVLAANWARVYGLNAIQSLTVLLCMFAVGRFIPVYLLRGARRRRQRRMLEVLPDFMDLISICLAAGLGVQEAIARVVDEVRELDAVFGDELRVSMLEVSAGRSVAESLLDLADRYGTSELRSLISVLIQSGRYGSSVAGTLDEYSESIRSSRLVAMEARAETIPGKMLLPTVLILLSTLLLVIGPMFWRVNDALMR